MSHVRTSKAKCKLIDPLKRAVAKFPKLKWKEGQKTYKWWGVWANDYARADAAYKNGIDVEDYGKCEHAIGVEGTDWEIGVCKRKDGQGYSLVWDFYGKSGQAIEAVIGSSAEKLMVEYQKQYLAQFASEQGFTFDLTVNEDNTETNILMGVQS